jgi:hypothetical protein
LSTFNKPIDHLPSSLTHLVLSFFFQQPNDNLPASLLYLTLGRKYNKPIDKLPPSLLQLTLGATFNKRLDKLPGSLTHLIAGDSVFNKPINKLPPSITHLTLGSNFHLEGTRESLAHLPPSLTYLSHAIVEDEFIATVNLPPTLTQLHLREYRGNLTFLPPSLTHLSLRFYKDTINFLSPLLTHFTLFNNHYQDILYLPPLLLSLSLPLSIPSDKVYLKLHSPTLPSLPPLFRHIVDMNTSVTLSREVRRDKQEIGRIEKGGTDSLVLGVHGKVLQEGE